MFYYVSKVVWFVIQPLHAVLLLLAIGVILLWSRWARMARRIVAAACLLLFAGGFSPLGHALLVPLEERFPRADIESGKTPTGIVVLGGAQDMLVGAARRAPALNEAGDRILEAVLLARRFPEARVVFTGGDSRLFQTHPAEATGSGAIAKNLGVDPKRMILEGQSKNTHENAIFAKELVKPRDGERWLLVTSASHMPRAMGSFRKAGFAVEPWPVDYRTRGRGDYGRLFSEPSEGWRRVDAAVREWVGLVAYRLTGRMDTLFPVPK